MLHFCRTVPEEEKHCCLFFFFQLQPMFWGMYWSSSKIQICLPPCPLKNYFFLIFSGVSLDLVALIY